jgi:hypothetical protein
LAIAPSVLAIRGSARVDRAADGLEDHVLADRVHQRPSVCSGSAAIRRAARLGEDEPHVVIVELADRLA